VIRKDPVLYVKPKFVFRVKKKVKSLIVLNYVVRVYLGGIKIVMEILFVPLLVIQKLHFFVTLSEVL